MKALKSLLNWFKGLFKTKKETPPSVNVGAKIESFKVKDLRVTETSMSKNPKETNYMVSFVAEKFDRYDFFLLTLKANESQGFFCVNDEGLCMSETGWRDFEIPSNIAVEIMRNDNIVKVLNYNINN